MTVARSCASWGVPLPRPVLRPAFQRNSRHVQQFCHQPAGSAEDVHVCDFNAVIIFRGQALEVVSHFRHLGSMITSDGMLHTKTTHRVARANSDFARLHQAKVWVSKPLSLRINLHFLQTMVMTVLLYAGEDWVLT